MSRDSQYAVNGKKRKRCLLRSPSFQVGERVEQCYPTRWVKRKKDCLKYGDGREDGEGGDGTASASRK